MVSPHIDHVLRFHLSPPLSFSVVCMSAHICVCACIHVCLCAWESQQSSLEDEVTGAGEHLVWVSGSRCWLSELSSNHS